VADNRKTGDPSVNHEDRPSVKHEDRPSVKHEDRPYILLTLGETVYGLPSAVVLQIEMVEALTPVPNAAPFVDGVVSSRGQIIPAVNLRARFGFERIPYDIRSRLVVVQAAGRTAGLIVDAAREFVSVPTDAIKPPPDTISGLSGRYLSGIVNLEGRLVLIIDAAELLSPVTETD
jgi:purine-binding chemotaxis protein CheW